jgi:hypothetical protein
MAAWLGDHVAGLARLLMLRGAAPATLAAAGAPVSPMAGMGMLGRQLALERAELLWWVTVGVCHDLRAPLHAGSQLGEL